MRTKKWPGLDAPTEEYTDLFGPYDERIDVRGLDRLIGEGVVELPVENRDPLELVLKAESLGIYTLNEDGMWENRDPFQILDDREGELFGSLERLFGGQGRRRSRQSRLVWHRAGYGPGDDRSLRQRPPIRNQQKPDLRRKAEIEHLRSLYSR